MDDIFIGNDICSFTRPSKRAYIWNDVILNIERNEELLQCDLKK